jgi:hypothetical protein
MDSSYRTPLLDLFRRGEAPADVRMLAARGALAPRAHEQLALLMLLATDEDAQIAAAANETIGRIPPAPLAAFLARHDVSDEVRDFFRRRGVEPAETPSDDAGAPLVAPEEEGATAEADSGALAAPEAKDEEHEATAQRLSRMTVADRIKRAMLGTREERYILVRDVNRMVAAAVLSSPKLSEADIEVFARMGNVSEDVLRVIGMNRAWTKNYSVMLGLCKHPKTPPALSMQIVPRLNERDLKMLAIDRNVPEGLRLLARKMVTKNRT